MRLFAAISAQRGLVSLRVPADQRHRLLPIPPSASNSPALPSPRPAPRAALVVKIDTLGDLVLFAPALRALRAAWPSTRLAVVVRRAYLDLASVLADGVEWLDASLDPFTHGPAADPAEFARIRDRVTALAPDLVVAATARRNWLELALAAAAPASARRVALGADTVDEHFGTQLRVHLGLDPTATAFAETVAVPAAEPDWQRNLRLAAALLGRSVAPAAPRLAPPAVPAVSDFLSRHGLAPGRYAVCAAAGFANVREKTWPAARYAAALAHLRDRHGLPAVLIGHDSERPYLESVAALVQALPPAPAPRPSVSPPPLVWTGGAGDLAALVALLGSAALYLGNDTGAMHLAAAVDLPVVALFGGGTWPRFVPAARRGLALVYPLPCFGCGWDCAFAADETPCLAGVTVAAATAALDAVLADPAAPFAIREVPLPAAISPAQHLAALAAASARHRAGSAALQARQRKLEELTALDREKDDEIGRLKAAADGKDAEIAALKRVCDEREQTIFILDGHVRHFQAENNQLKADKLVLEKSLADLPAEPARAARTIADQVVHIRNLEALRLAHEAELAELRRNAANRTAGLHDLENAKHYGRLLAEKEAVIQSLGRGLADRERLIAELTAEATHSTADLRKLWLAAAAWFRARVAQPFDEWLFRTVVEGYWMQIGVLRHYDPRPLVWDARLAAASLPAAAALPRIAVVTPSYNQEKFLARTLRSVLDQAYPKLLYAVQDGASKDGSPALIAAHADRLRHWESVKDHGQADAIRRGFARLEPDLAPDDLMAWLNSDDLVAPGAFAAVAAYFAAHPEVDVVYGHRIIIDEDDRDVGRWVMPPHDPATLEWIDYVPQETMFWRKRAWDRVGGLDPSFQFALDWDLLARFQQAGCTMVRLPYFLGAFRVHSEQKTSQAIHTVGAEEMRRIRARFHGERHDDFVTIDRFARRARFWGAVTARLHALGLRR